jgi:ribosomal-protein-alanine N-acetyltransferase
MDRFLSTTRLRLRAPQPGDADFAFERWARDIDVLRYLGWGPHAEREQTRRQLDWDIARWTKRSAYTWLLLPHGDRGPVGQVQLLPQSFEAPAHHLRLGFLLARSHQRRGLMREALAALLEHAFAHAHVWRIDALTDVENTASQALLERLGLRREGRLARHTLHPNVGALPRDVWIYAAVREPV